MNGRRALYGAVGLLALTSACLAFDGAGGAEEAFCLERPSICAEAGRIDRPDAGTWLPKDGGTTLTDGGNPGTFAPGKIGLIGTLWEGSVADVYCTLESPTISYAGLYAWGRVLIHPTSGAIYYLYKNDNEALELRRFVVDRVYQGKAESYPSDWERNDPVIPTPQCEGESGLDEFHIKPDGAIVYRCVNGDHWFDVNTGQPVETCVDVFDKPTVQAFADDGATFCGYSVMDAEGVQHDVTGRPFQLGAVRSRPGGGFWALGRTDEGRFQRWFIASDGTATVEGDYAEPPQGWSPVNADSRGWAILDPAGNFYRWGIMDVLSAPDTIVKFSADFSSSAIVYDEDDTEVCNFHGSMMVTTP